MVDRRLEIGHRKMKPGERPIFMFMHIFHPLSLTHIINGDGDEVERDDEKLNATNAVRLPWKTVLDGLNIDDVEDLCTDEEFEAVQKSGEFKGKTVFWTDSDVHLEVPARFDVCSTCEGIGKHVNPNIDRRGLTREDFDADPEFAENYFGGMYDQTCNECDGNKVMPTIHNRDGSVMEEYAALEERENGAIEDDFADRKTRWMEDGCNPDSGPEDYR